MQITGWCLPAHILLLFMLHLAALLWNPRALGTEQDLCKHWFPWCFSNARASGEMQAGWGHQSSPHKSRLRVESALQWESYLLPTPLSCLVGQFLKISPPKGQAEPKGIFDWNHHKDQSWSRAELAIWYLMREWYRDKGPAMEETLEAQVACEEISLGNWPWHCKELKERRGSSSSLI